MLLTDPPFKPDILSLQTKRLNIRISPQEDYVQNLNTKSDQELQALYGFVTEDIIRMEQAKAAAGFCTHRTNLVFFHLIEKRLGIVIGSFAFHNWFPMHRRTEIGYAMLQDEYKNMGFMSEAIQLIIPFGFQQMDLNRMEAFIHPENVASRKLVEGMGFKQEGWLKEHFCKNDRIEDSLVYGLLEREFNGSKNIRR